MNLSWRAMTLCAQRTGIGPLCGFEETDGAAADGLTQEEAEQVLGGLMDSGMMDLSGDEVRVSDLGYHLLHMMNTPEICVRLEREDGDRRVRFYERNTYYLCVIEDLRETSADSYERFRLELLPKLELVVGAFAYALQSGEGEIRISGQAWNRERECVSEYRVTEPAGADVSEAVNRLTAWMLTQIGEGYRREAE